jgi:hypothetical protein
MARVDRISPMWRPPHQTRRFVRSVGESDRLTRREAERRFRTLRGAVVGAALGRIRGVFAAARPDRDEASTAARQALAYWRRGQASPAEDDAPGPDRRGAAIATLAMFVQAAAIGDLV